MEIIWLVFLSGFLCLFFNPLDFSQLQESSGICFGLGFGVATMIVMIVDIVVIHFLQKATWL